MTRNAQAAAKDARARYAAFLTQNSRLEGIEPSAESLADSAEWVAGTITAAEVVARARARCGLDETRTAVAADKG